MHSITYSMPILMICFTFFLLILCVHAGIEKCIFLNNPSKTGTLVQFNVLLDQGVLQHLYDNKGDCKLVAHMDSVAINGACTNLDLHEDDRNHFHRCNKLRMKSKMGFRKCFWNRSNVKKWGIVQSENVKRVSIALVQMFDKKDCAKLIGESWILVG